MITITRKIQLLFNTEGESIDSAKEIVKNNYATLYRWQHIVKKAANMIATTHYCMENIKDMFFLNDETKVKLADAKKDEDGILTTSRLNTTYQLLSKHFKGDIPTSILTALNSNVVQTFNAEKKQYFTGERSLRNYRNNIPIPIRFCAINNIIKQEEYKNYFLTICGINFRTNFGRDNSDNQTMFERALAGEYKFCDSSIELDGNKIFLLAVFQFEKNEIKLDAEIIAEANLGLEVPIIVNISGKTKKLNIGNKEEYLHRRLAIQASLRRAQIGSRYNKGGHGIQKKIKAIDQFKEKEDNYIKTRIHTYTKRLIDFCVKNKCGKLVLKNQQEKELEAKADEKLLRNWTYFGMKEKIMYKANIQGIEVIIE